MASTSEKTLTLRSRDGEIFEVEENVAMQSETMKHMIEDGCADTVIPLPNVTSKTLAKVIEYCKVHVESGASHVGGDWPSKDKWKEWDKEFVNVDPPTLFDLIMAANYLVIKGLLDLTCQTVADIIRDNSPEEIREILDIKNDYTPEEEEEIRRENQWAFE